MEWPSETAQDGALAPHLAKDGRHSQTPEQFILTVIPTLVVAILSPFYLRQYYSQPVRVLSDRLLSAKMVNLSFSRSGSKSDAVSARYLRKHILTRYFLDYRWLPPSC